MATFNISERVSFTYTYAERDGKQIADGKFFKAPGNHPLGVSLKVARKTRPDAVNDIHTYAKALGQILDSELK